MANKLILLLTSFILALLACNKDYSAITGYVRSSADNKPIEGANVTLSFSKTRQSGGGMETIASDHQLTGVKGQYSLELTAKDAERGHIKAEKKGFAPMKAIRVDPGDSKEIDITLHPYDAWLSLTFENWSTQSRTYTYTYTGKYLDSYLYCVSGCGPFALSPYASRTVTGLIPGGAEITITWNDNNTHTVFCERNDTTFVNIKL
jgi:hypothetical protein